MSTKCPLCGATKFADWRFGLRCCENCDLVVNEAVWQPAANEVLNDASFGDDYEPVRSFWVRMFESWNNRRTIRRLRGVLRSGKDLLEIGVGSGSFLAYAKANAYSPLGCDLSSAICRRVERDTGIAMHCGLLESLPDGQRFDVVVMNHILEHVSDPVAMLKIVLTRLKPGGVLHLAVPNVGAWEARLPGWGSYEPYHLLYFTPKTLRATLEKAGFTDQRLTTHESFSGWFLAVLRTLLRKSNLKQDKSESSKSTKHPPKLVEHPYRLIMVAWGLFTFPFRWLQNQFGKGDELIIIARAGTGE